MNYINLQFKKKISKVVKNLTAFCAFFLTLVTVFYSLNALALPDCSTLSGTISPGTNCWFMGLRACAATDSTSNRRSTCADLIDLPLCSQMDNSSNAINKKNCVKECSDSSILPSPLPSGGVRGQDYAVHNRDCIRFCDSPETGVTANSGVNCTGRKCHQLASGTTPTAGTNCNIVDCNLLTVDELNESKFIANPDKKYCEGTGIKCYSFSEDKLQYLIVGKMCQVHNCPVSSSTCGADDTLNITNKTSTFQTKYITYINGGMPITSGLCNPILCKPVVKRLYQCTGGNPTATPPVPESSPVLGCDLTGAGNTCSQGFCYKTIDCNSTANNNENECAVSVTDGSNASSTENDPNNDWFHRPKPMDKAYDNNAPGTSYRSMDRAEICYHDSQLDDNGWGAHPTIDFGLLGTLDLGYYHSFLLPDRTRSPGNCGSKEDGFRGVGYSYLCGNSGNLMSRPSSSTAYHRNIVSTVFTEGEGTHSLTVCLRYKNDMRPDDGTSETCGARECGISCAFSLCKSQVCGYDLCRTLTVLDSTPKACADGNTSGDCSATMGGGASADSYLRLRAIKYGNKICTFLDVKGQTAYDSSLFLRGDEKLSDGTCVSGTSSACTGGKDSASSPGSATEWRTIKFSDSPAGNIPYIQNNRPAGTPTTARGYIDLTGRLFKERECIATALRISPPRFYNLANTTNSQKLFTPPLYISNALTRRDGSVAIPVSSSKTNGETDFNYPAMTVKYGAETKVLSLGIGYNGHELGGTTTPIDPLGSATITTNVNGSSYSAEIIAKKEYSGSPARPIFCLYRKVKDPSTNNYIDPVRVGCVDRKFPEINNFRAVAINSSLCSERLNITAGSSNTYSSASMVIKYFGGFDSDPNTSGCQASSSNSESATITLNNSNVTTPTCSYDIGKFPICAQREECTQLNNECILNESAIQTARTARQPIDSLLTTRNYCNRKLLPLCNAKKGITASDSDTILSSDPNITNSNSLAYGWFNEICIVSGFENKLRTIVANNPGNGVKGKCLVDPASPYLTDGLSSTNCNDGGRAPNCLCIESIDENDLTADQLARKETPREAGLCIDIPLPQKCSAINFMLTPNPDTTDPDYITYSLNNSTYGTSFSNYGSGVNKVHLIHQYRTLGKSSPSPILLRGHAEFPTSVLGANSIEGTCSGFWKYQTSNGVNISPKLSCLNNSGGASWDTSVTSPCIRYTCNSITTTGPDANGNYQGGYDDGVSDKGVTHGYATWPSLTKSDNSDAPETATATACIAGYKRIGSSALNTGSQTITADPSLTLAQTIDKRALYQLIGGYSGGTLPTRQCNQLGQWLTPTNVCQRIVCAAISPPTPTGSSDTAAWNAWNNAGGATFPQALASRSIPLESITQSESISTGTCNQLLGFFPSPGGLNPTRKCDYLGNWQPVENACVTKCDPINTLSAASVSNNGFAYWKGADNVALGGEADGVVDNTITASGCVAGYYKYPYPPTKDKYGNALSSSVANDLTRPSVMPARVCRSVITTGGATNVWGATSSSCVDKCPGYDVDTREGVGATTHSILSAQGAASTVSIHWSSQDWGTAGTYQYYSSTGCGSSNASNFYPQGRTNGCYVMRRKCNVGGLWDAPEALCVAGEGEISDHHATYKANDPVASGVEDSLPAGSTTLLTGACSTGYWAQGSTSTTAGASPQIKCMSDGIYINRTYWTLNAGSSGCEQITCPNNTTIADTARASVNTATATSFVVGTKAYGTCSANHLLVADNDASTIDTPYVTCQSNGAWSSTVTNAAKCERSCTVSSHGQCIDADNCGKGNRYRFADTDAPLTLKSREFIHFNIYDVCGGSSASWSLYGVCNDGAYTDKNNTTNVDGDSTNYYFYNTATGAWEQSTASTYRDFGQIVDDSTTGTLYNSEHSFVDGNNVTRSSVQPYIRHTNKDYCRTDWGDGYNW